MARQRREHLSIEEQMRRAQSASEDMEENTSPATQIPVELSPLPVPVSEDTQKGQYQEDEIHTKKFDNEPNNSVNEVSIDTIRKLLDVYKKYKHLDNRVQQTVTSFLGVDTLDDVSVVYHIVNSTKADSDAIIDIANLRAEDSLSRAFSLMALSEERLKKVNELTMMFSRGFEQDSTLENKIEYCRKLEQGISSLPEEAVGFLRPMGELFRLGKE